MQSEDRERRIDEFLDAALARYSETESRPGLEQRILANLEAKQRAARPWRWLAWGAAVAAVAFAAYVAMRPAPPRIVMPIAQQPQGAPVVANPPQVAVQQRVKQVPRLAAKKQVTKPAVPAVARLEQFPTPAPLTEQERLLLRFVRQEPEEAVLMARAQEAAYEQALRAAESQQQH